MRPRLQQEGQAHEHRECDGTDRPGSRGGDEHRTHGGTCRAASEQTRQRGMAGVRAGIHVVGPVLGSEPGDEDRRPRCECH